jgi:LuxR family maltose regulon positive regulatory protein
MPKSAYYTLTWSSSSQAYALCEGQGEEALELDSPAWSLRVSQLASFAFHGHNGSYTARQEHRQRGGQYWYAYARVAGKLTKRYLGRGTELTLTRLEQVAQALWLEPPAAVAAVPQEEASASSRPRPASPTPAGRKTEHQSGVGGRTAGGPAVLAGLPPDMLLASKLQGPPLRPHLVPRPRLLHQLQQGLERTLILLSAPAGCGKSTLLAEWLASGALPFAWLALEPADNEPAHFCSSLLAALQTTDPRLGGRWRAQVSSQPLHPPRVERLLTALLNELLARGSDEGDHVVLVLDDYHVITNEAIHAALRLLLEHRPPQLHLVLSTRADPPLPLARLRGRDALLELRAADLQFTPEESSTYLVERRGLPLSAQERALLHARTEGWITGLQLAALALQGRADASGFIATFSGSHHYVADYLLDEVLSRQSAAIQDFLLQTSILERLSGPLCDAVRGQHDSQAQLGSLEQANLFVVPLDDERRWYRYHQLFAQVLQQRLQHSAPSLIPELHRRASRWYEQQGYVVEALSHALAAPAFEEAARLLEQYSATCLAGSQRLALLEWLHALPERLLLAPAALGLLQALVLMDPEQWEEASARLQAVGQGMDLGEDAQDAQGRLFLEEGPPMMALLREAQRQGLTPAHVAKPLRAASKRDGTASPLPAPQRSLLVEPLTARERDVLQLLLDGASNQEIACQLTLSVNTVKKHVLNICGKLNVQRRVQAIAKARMLQLP